MEICPYIVQNKTNRGSCPFRANRTQSQKQRLNFSPFNIAIYRICEDRVERFSVFAVHSLNDSIYCYHGRFEINELNSK